jgi:flagella basal body P-ring formation protein FlgA
MRGRAGLGGTLLAAALAAAPPLAAQEVIAARTLRAGTVVAAGDLRARTPGADAAERIAALLGLETRRAIYAGRPITVGDLGPPTLVRRNALVVMTYTAGALGIRTEGRALEAGGEGEVIRVINLGSRQAVRAVVTGTNRVEVRR